MAFEASPEPDDQDLLAYIDGEAGPEVQRHVESCPRCQARVRQLAVQQDRLRARLYRAQCPTPHELGEYHLGLLPPTLAKAVVRHLSGCPHCQREVDQLAAYLGELAPAVETGLLERVREGVRVLVARLLSAGPEIGSLGQPALAPAGVGIRGQEREPRVYQAEGIQVVIGVQPDAGRPGSKVILGLVIGLDPREVKAHLWQANRLVDTAAVDELGNFCLAGLLPGTYELFLSSPELEIHIQDLEIGTG